MAIAGTSIGAVVGGLWAAGALDRYEERMLAMTKAGVVWLLDPKLPRAGFFGGDKLASFLRELCADRTIDELRIPFCSVASELETGSEVRLREGDLVHAMHCSYAIPGLFTPQQHEGRWLVDGGVVAPVPVDAASSLSDAPVIAVNLNTRAPSHRFHSEKPPNILQTIGDSLLAIMNRVAALELERVPPALIIEPNLEDVGFFDYHQTERAIAEGERAAREVLTSRALRSL